ncbi:MAG: 3-phosphoshikimate 1-carboxyvinyltransferase [Peptococcaceae bacterium]|nr:3-phosphoshikimate 1-carboxyvinyltransferase [Peptococcaceae bacterium]
MNKIITGARGLRGTITVPGDKSISHRAVMLGAIAEGETLVENFLTGADCMATMKCFQAMGVPFAGPDRGRLKIYGRGLHGLREPAGILDAENSGTTMRLITGILSGQPFFSVITGDKSLLNRPMGRVVNPLTKMGAAITGRNENTLAPLAIKGGRLKAIDYNSPVASAQIKSAVLLAGLYADGRTFVAEPSKSRDHTERMLKYFGAEVEVTGNRVGVSGGCALKGANIIVPGDISSAAFFLVAASVVPDSDITIRGVGTNPTRDGIIEALLKMGADIKVFNTREVNNEPVSDIRARSAGLRGTVISGDLIPRLIDEIPVLAVAASVAEGETVVRDAAELKVKESNRIAAVVGELRKFGVDIAELEDGFVVRPGNRLTGAAVDPRQDHRIAMAMSVAGLVAEGETVIHQADCVKISFPGFYDVLKSLEKV